LIFLRKEGPHLFVFGTVISCFKTWDVAGVAGAVVQAALQLISTPKEGASETASSDTLSTLSETLVQEALHSVDVFTAEDSGRSVDVLASTLVQETMQEIGRTC
jgi:hypothetical protein